MKILLLILSLLPVVALAQLDDPAWLATATKPVTPSGALNITADFFQTFELNADNSAAELDKSDGVAGANWDTTVDSQSMLTCTSSSASKSMASTVNGAAVTTTRGMAVDMSGTAGAYIFFYMPATHDSISLGFWLYTPAQQNFNAVTVASIINSNGDGYTVSYGDNAGDGGGATRIKFGANTDTVTVTAATWYWITVKMVRNGTSSMSVYTADSGGSQVGTTKTLTAADFPMQALKFGSLAAYSVATTAYFDNLLIDWTDATFPLIGQ